MKNLLVILPRVPYPLDKGDKLRAFNQIRVLSGSFNIHLCCLNDQILHPGAEEALRKYTHSIHIFRLSRSTIFLNVIKAFFTGKPLQTGYFYSSKAARSIKNICDRIKPNHIYCQLIRTAEYAIRLDVPKTIDYQDVFSKGVERRMIISPWYLKLILKIEYKRLLKYEALVFNAFANKTIISEPDREFIPHPLKDQIYVIPNGVDLKYFCPIKMQKQYDLVFTGNMSYPPNINSAIYLIDEILPLIIKSGRKLNVLIAGASPHSSLTARASENVHISGWQDDIRDSYNKSKVFIAPMQIGTGLQNKLLEAMAMRMPCITSPLANAALKARPGIEIIVCSSPEEYAESIINLIENTNFADQIAINGHQFVKQNYIWEETTRELEKIINNTK